MEQTDMLGATADAKLDLAGILHGAGKHSEALQEIEEAADLYKRKRHLVGVARARELLESPRQRA